MFSWFRGKKEDPYQARMEGVRLGEKPLEKDPRDVKHVMVSGWTATQQGARENAGRARAELEAQGVESEAENWTTMSDPRQWQVLKNKRLMPGKSKVSHQVADTMVENSLAKNTTVWHGHSQGGAQITAGTRMAERKLAKHPMIRAKAKRTVEKKHGHLGGVEKEMAIRQEAERRAKRRINRRNMFSYSGAASAPPSVADHATSTHNAHDPVSGLVRPMTSGRHGDRPDRKVVNLDPDARPMRINPFKSNIGDHGFNENYAAQDAANTKWLLDGKFEEARPDAPPIVGKPQDDPDLAEQAEAYAADPAMESHGWGDGKDAGAIMGKVKGFFGGGGGGGGAEEEAAAAEEEQAAEDEPQQQEEAAAGAASPAYTPFADTEGPSGVMDGGGDYAPGQGDR